MSFSSDVKNELCRLDIEKKCCAKSELAGIISFCGTYKINDGNEIFELKTENPAVARRVFSLVKKLFGENIVINQTKRKNRGSLYSIVFSDILLHKVLLETRLKNGDIVKFSISPFLIQDTCCTQAYLRGAFLGGGSVNSPKKSYHLEIETHYHDLANELTELICDIELGAKCILRKSSYVTYIKNSEKISDFLGTIGATDSMIELYNIKIYKDMKNNITRIVNCDTANVLKTATAAMQQRRSIEKIIDKMGLESLPESLKELALLRLENPDASLLELSQMLKTPLSRSGVNHRFKKLDEIADKL